MRVVYSFRTDPEYCRAVINRYYRQMPVLLRLRVQFGILGLVAAVLCWNSNPFAGALAGLLIFVVGVSATKLGLMLKLRSAATFNQDVDVTVSQDGVEAKGKHARSHWEWAAYPRAVRFPDGILLLRAGVLRWLPDVAIKDGTAEQATALVQSKSVLRHIA